MGSLSCKSPFDMKIKRNDRVPMSEGLYAEVRCGQCMPCRIRRREEWTARMIMEARLWSPALVSFITLTYKPESVPAFGSLRLRDVQLFLKRYRKNTRRSVRYFLCGEYGTSTHRPHYHMILYGHPVNMSECILEAWQNGFVAVKPAHPKSFRYVAKYVTKSALPDDTKRVCGKYSQHLSALRVKPFALTSRHPGLGLDYLPNVARSLEKFMTNTGSDGFCPVAMKFSGRWYPFDRTVKDRLRKLMGPAYDRTLSDYLRADLEVRRKWLLEGVEENQS